MVIHQNSVVQTDITLNISLSGSQAFIEHDTSVGSNKYCPVPLTSILPKGGKEGGRVQREREKEGTKGKVQKTKSESFFHPVL